jgi:hypothetical protein
VLRFANEARIEISTLSPPGAIFDRSIQPPTSNAGVLITSFLTSPALCRRKVPSECTKIFFSRLSGRGGVGGGSPRGVAARFVVDRLAAVDVERFFAVFAMLPSRAHA